MINSIRHHDYAICGYHEYLKYDKCAILRHDVDFDLEKALRYARLENKLSVCSTYFILLTSDFYNIASAKNRNIINELLSSGHEIGLHFDEASYAEDNDIPAFIEREIEIMSDILGYPIKTVSMHRPSRKALECDFKLQGIVNAYSMTFFEEFKYLSDSRHCWREPVMEIIESSSYKKLHILTHPFWYSENRSSAKEVITEFVNSANAGRYADINENIRDLAVFMKKENVK